MTRIAAALACAVALSGCSQADLDRFIAAIDTAETVLSRVSQGIEHADAVAKRYCPDLESIGNSARERKCAADASGTEPSRLERIARYRDRFCANPTAKSATELASFIAEGLRAARAATVSGCTAPQ